MTLLANIFSFSTIFSRMFSRTHKLRYLRAISKKEKPQNHCGFKVFLELLGRFELPTSSLPTTVEPSSPCCIRLCGVFLSRKEEVAACLFHCFRPLISPCGSRCGSSGHLRVKETTDRLRRHISFCHFSLVIDSGNFLNESFLLFAGFRP